MDEYLRSLDASLKHMRPEEKQEILDDYREHFAIGLEDGKSAETIAAELGDPQQIARMYTASTAANKAHQSRRFGDTIRMLGAALSYKVGGGLAIGILYIVAVSALLCLFAATLGLMAGGAGVLIVAVVNLVKDSIQFALFMFFAALTLVCGGALAWLGSIRLWRGVFGHLPLLARRMVLGKTS